ncbi:MAG: hypothetical protein QNK05_20125 [Myxococcota bacterium]|nr:hypothetical protein [Myxococcota bacterium]
MSVKAARDSKKQGDRAAEQERLATAEKVRRLRLQAGQIVGAQAAGAAASGVDINSGSIRALQAETVAEFDRQIAFTQTAGAFAAEAAEVAGRSAAFQNLSAGLNSLTSAVRIIDNAGGLRKTFGLG